MVRKKTVMWADCQLEMESSASESPCAGTGKELHPLLWRPSVCWDNDIKDSPLCCLESEVVSFTEQGHAESAVLLCIRL